MTSERTSDPPADAQVSGGGSCVGVGVGLGVFGTLVGVGVAGGGVTTGVAEKLGGGTIEMAGVGVNSAYDGSGVRDGNGAGVGVSWTKIGRLDVGST